MCARVHHSVVVQFNDLTQSSFLFYAGLSDDARADFHLMKDIAVYTRISPETRMQSLNAFMRDLQSYGILSMSCVDHSTVQLCV